VKPPDSKKPGTTIAGFTIMSEVGSGAASRIYLVQDPKTKQVWALKHVVRDGPKDTRFLEQTEREFQVGSKLDHDGFRHFERIIKNRKLMTVNEMYLLMEYVDGVSCEQRPPTNLVDSVDIFRQVASSLAYMHKRGFIHADMKPNNIIITAGNRARIIDLGQSCPDGTVKPRIQGTPDYIAPEQVHRRPITPRTDIYNLGATMYWVLTGTHIPTALPKGDSLVKSLDDEFIEKARPVGQVNTAVPGRLNDLVMQCIEVKEDNRPPDMQSVADRLDLIYAKIKTGPKPSAKPGDVAVSDGDEG
jgi:serine/threonine-protein kinase